ncbi:glutathione ABC transporter permease GsiC [soil metagenome]
MGFFILRRLLLMIPVLFGVTVIVFMIIHLAPGDPAQMVAGPTAPPEVVENVREQLGLNRPILIQYGTYMGNVFQGDLGRSLVTRRSVSDEIRNSFWYTLELVLVARVWSVVVAIPLGVLAAYKRNTIWDKLSMALALVGISFPIFFVGLLLIWLFAAKLGWFPISGRGGPLWTLDGWRYIALPAFTLGYFQVAALARVVRSSMLEVLRRDYVLTARAKGLGERNVLYRHALKNALLPAITVIGLQFGFLLGGAVVTETIFSWPGMGRLVVGAINYRDFPMVQGPILVLAALFVLINLLVDISYGLIDPRVRKS